MEKGQNRYYNFTREKQIYLYFFFYFLYYNISSIADDAHTILI